MMGIISRIHLREFRNLASVDIELSPGLNVVVGRNGQGKTSLLEGIYFLAFLRSFRTRRPVEMIRWGNPGFNLEAVVSPPSGVTSALSGARIGVFYSDHRELIRDGKNIAVAADFINAFLCVALVPEDLGLIKGAPLLRRRFIDMLLCQTSREYLATLLKYNRTLVNRNAMLKDPRRYGESAIRGYDSVLAATGAELTLGRVRGLRQFGELFGQLYQELHGGPCEVEAIFKSSIFRRQAEGASPVDLENGILVCLEREFDRDVERRTTRYGPHRDDLTINLQNRSLSIYGSEGQCRLAALALKLASMKLLANTASLKNDIVLLVDDVFGELDERRRGGFFAVAQGAAQMILACTSPPPELAANPRRYTMNAGQIFGTEA